MSIMLGSDIAVAANHEQIQKVHTLHPGEYVAQDPRNKIIAHDPVLEALYARVKDVRGAVNYVFVFDGDMMRVALRPKTVFITSPVRPEMTPEGGAAPSQILGRVPAPSQMLIDAAARSGLAILDIANERA